jgi:hypothetical protein
MTQRLFSAFLLASALLFAAEPAHAAKDAVQFGSNIVIPEGQSVRDAVCFFCSVNAKGSVDHDLVVFFGNAHIARESRHDVVVFFGNVHAADNASIGHDVVNFFGTVRLGENVSVGGDAVAMFGGLHAADSVQIAGSRFSQPIWIFWAPLLLFGLIVTLIVREIRAWRHRQFVAAYGYPPMPPQPPAPPAPPVN